MLRDDERPALDALGGPTDDAQTLLWSMKEAVLKGQRTGLRAGARSVRLTLDTAPPGAVAGGAGGLGRGVGGVAAPLRPRRAAVARRGLGRGRGGQSQMTSAPYAANAASRVEAQSLVTGEKQR